MREKYLPTSIKKEDGSFMLDIDGDADKRDMYGSVQFLISNSDNLHKVLGDNLKVYSGETDGYWKDVETPDKNI